MTSIQKHSFDNEFYRNIFMEGDWSLSIMSYDDNNSDELPPGNLKSVSKVFVGMLIYMRLQFSVSIPTTLNSSSCASTSTLAEDVIEHILSNVEVYFERSFIKRNIPTYLDLSSIIDEDITLPDDVYNNVISCPGDSSFMESKWAWESVRPQQIPHGNDRTPEESEHFIEVPSEDIPPFRYDSVASTVMIRFSRYFPIFIGTL
jgi:hypothetical protein